MFNAESLHLPSTQSATDNRGSEKKNLKKENRRKKKGGALKINTCALALALFN